MTSWQDVPAPHLTHEAALDAGTLILPDSFYSYACLRGERCVSLKVDAVSHRLGMVFHDNAGHPSALLLKPVDRDSVWGARAYIADASALLANYDWLKHVAESRAVDLHKVPITHSPSENMWIGSLPCVFPNEPTTFFGKSVAGDSRGVLRVWNDDRIVAVSNCLLRRYVADRDFQLSAWTAFDYAVIPDRNSRAFSARWWRRHVEATQGKPIEHPTLESWPGYCRSPVDILGDKGWSSDAIEILRREIYDELVGPGETILPDHLIEEWNEYESLDTQALLPHLTQAEKLEARKYYAIEEGDYEEDEDEQEVEQAPSSVDIEEHAEED